MEESHDIRQSFELLLLTRGPGSNLIENTQLRIELETFEGKCLCIDNEFTNLMAGRTIPVYEHVS